MKLTTLQTAAPTHAGRPLIDGILHTRCLTVLSGAKSNLTTTSAVTLASAVAAGSTYDDRTVYTPTNRDVLYLTTSDSPRSILDIASRIRDLDPELLAANLQVAICPDASPREGQASELRSALAQLKQQRDDVPWALIVIDDIAEAFFSLQLQRPLDAYSCQRELRAIIGKYSYSLLAVGRARSLGDTVRNSAHFNESADIDLRVRRWTSSRDKERNPNKAGTNLVPTHSRITEVINAYHIEVDAYGYITPRSLEDDESRDIREMNQPDWCRERSLMNHIITSVLNGHKATPDTPAHVHVPTHRVDGAKISQYNLDKLVEDIGNEFNVPYEKERYKSKRKYIAAMVIKLGPDMARAYTAADLTNNEETHIELERELEHADF